MMKSWNANDDDKDKIERKKIQETNLILSFEMKKEFLFLLLENKNLNRGFLKSTGKPSGDNTVNGRESLQGKAILV